MKDRFEYISRRIDVSVTFLLKLFFRERKIRERVEASATAELGHQATAAAIQSPKQANLWFLQDKLTVEAFTSIGVLR